MSEKRGQPDVKRQVFVAYSYREYPAEDYRRIFGEIEAEYDVAFVFADEKITNMHILQKIISYIRASDFALFDITGWNPNVTLELGFAMATSDSWYIAFNPARTDLDEVPADLRGIDRVQYGSFAELGAKLRALIEQQYPKRTASIDTYLEDLRTAVRQALSSQPGMTVLELSELLGASVAVTQLAVRPLVGTELETTGRTRAMKYFLRGDAPAPRGS
jgi:hypothetical protein